MIGMAYHDTLYPMGRPKSDAKLVPVMVRLAAAEVEQIDAQRGDRSRSDYVRSVLSPSSGGAGIQPTPTGPTGAHDALLPAPPDPRPGVAEAVAVASAARLGPPERPPSDRQLAARVFAAMRDIDPTDAGPVTTPEEATFLRQWAQRTLDAWKAVYAPPAPAGKPQRRQGTITRPADRLNGTAARPSTRVTIPTIPAPKLAKRHADDCSCLSCVPPKAAAK